jgi:hypothetical protein
LNTNDSKFRNGLKQAQIFRKKKLVPWIFVSQQTASRNSATAIPQMGSNRLKSSEKSWFHGFLYPNRLHQETLQQESLKWAQTDSNLQKKTVGSMVVFFLNRLHQETFAFGGPAYLTPPFTAGAFPMFMGGSEPPFTFTGTLGTPSFPTALAPGLAFALAYSSVGSV